MELTTVVVLSKATARLRDVQGCDTARDAVTQVMPKCFAVLKWVFWFHVFISLLDFTAFSGFLLSMAIYTRVRWPEQEYNDVNHHQLTSTDDR